MVFCGKTGLQAAMAHAPQEDGIERYLFFCGPHIAISANGEVGGVFREGREKISHACGALMSFLEELESGHVKVLEDIDDIEMILTKQHLMPYLKYGEVPTLPQLTKYAHACIDTMVEKTLKSALAPTTRANYAIVSYILIHGPNSTNYVWVGNMRASIEKKPIDLLEEYRSKQ